jgi:hypothetical protein
MYFQRGKRKANSSIQVVDARSNTRTSFRVPAPNSLEIVDETERSEGNSWNDMSDKSDNYSSVDDSSDYDSDTQFRTPRSYKKRRERLCSNWDKIRQQLLRTSLAIEGFIPSTCSESTCSRPVKTRCRDCGFSVYYCKECCDVIHKNKLQFHVCEVFEVSGGRV